MVWTCCWVIYQSTLLWSGVTSYVGSFSFLHIICCSLGLLPQKIFCLDRPRYPCKKSLFSVFQFACFVSFSFASKIFLSLASNVSHYFHFFLNIYFIKKFNIRIIFNALVYIQLWLALLSTWCINFSPFLAWLGWRFCLPPCSLVLILQ